MRSRRGGRGAVAWATGGAAATGQWAAHPGVNFGNVLGGRRTDPCSPVNANLCSVAGAPVAVALHWPRLPAPVGYMARRRIPSVARPRLRWRRGILRRTNRRMDLLRAPFLFVWYTTSSPVVPDDGDWRHCHYCWPQPRVSRDLTLMADCVPDRITSLDVQIRSAVRSQGGTSAPVMKTRQVLMTNLMAFRVSAANGRC